MKNNKLICIIPARAGSKRIKNKNIKFFLGKPIIAWTIELALKSKLFDKIIVSTDSKKIAKISKKLGAEIIFREKNLSGDKTTTKEVLLDTIKKINYKNYKYFFCIYPCSPLIKTKHLKEGLQKIKSTNYDSLTAITNFDHPPQRALKKSGNNIQFYNKLSKNKNTQSFEVLYRDAGSFYIYKTKNFISKSILKNTYYDIPKAFSVDIDTIEDFNLAELIAKGMGLDGRN